MPAIAEIGTEVRVTPDDDVQIVLGPAKHEFTDKKYYPFCYFYPRTGICIGQDTPSPDGNSVYLFPVHYLAAFPDGSYTADADRFYFRINTRQFPT